MMYSEEEKDLRIEKMENQLKIADLIILHWDRYGDKHGCANDEMNQLFRINSEYIETYIL